MNEDGEDRAVDDREAKLQRLYAVAGECRRILWSEAMTEVISRIQAFVDTLAEIIERISAAFGSARREAQKWGRKRKLDRRGLRVGRGVNVGLPPPLYVSWCPIGRRG